MKLKKKHRLKGKNTYYCMERNRRDEIETTWLKFSLKISNDSRFKKR